MPDACSTQPHEMTPADQARTRTTSDLVALYLAQRWFARVQGSFAQEL
jgi:hypothetical protein